ncbi:MAG: hypothetical protein J7M15_03015 [Anaerolineae bacterium]|nr:hypothetical protein [Anaerolineae bacterium]
MDDWAHRGPVVQCCARQDQDDLIAHPSRIGVSRSLGETLESLEGKQRRTPEGLRHLGGCVPRCKLGLVVGGDVLFPEVEHILCLPGAALLVPPGISFQGSRYAMMVRLWRDVQANQVYGLESG